VFDVAGLVALLVESESKNRRSHPSRTVAGLMTEGA
jgi:hypothetical protein